MSSVKLLKNNYVNVLYFLSVCMVFGYVCYFSNILLNRRKKYCSCSCYRNALVRRIYRNY